MKCWVVGEKRSCPTESTPETLAEIFWKQVKKKTQIDLCLMFPPKISDTTYIYSTEGEVLENSHYQKYEVPYFVACQ